MAKKKQQDDSEENQMTPVQENATLPTAESQPKAAANPLMEEIETFMSMRDELAQKLAAEIEATERKLEELKNTAASLFPQNGSTDTKKPKKPKPKPAKEEKVSDSASDG